jgi:hypothetical protein
VDALCAALIGLVGAVIGFAFMSRWQVDTAYATMVPHLVLTGVGIGLTIAPIAAAVVDASPEGYRGTASGAVIIFRLIGMTLGVSSMTTYGLYRADVLSARWLLPLASLSEVVRVGLEVATTVVNETFLIAGVVCLLAFLPVFRLGDIPMKGESDG